MRSEHPARESLPMPGDGERALQASRRPQHRTENGGGNRAHPARCHEAGALYGVHDGRTAGCSRTGERGADVVEPG